MVHPFRADEASRGGRSPIRAWGPLTDGPRAGEILEAIRGRLERGARRIVLDLSAVPFLDGGGVGILLRGRSAAIRSGASFRVAGAAGQARRTLRLAGLLGLLEDGSGLTPRKEPAGQDAPLLLIA